MVITWHVVIQAVESLPWIGLAAPLSPSAWDKGLPFSKSLYWFNLNHMHSHWHPTVTPDSAPSPVGVIPSLSKLLKAWSLLYSSGGVEKCYWNPHYDPLLPPPPVAASDKVLLWDLLLKTCWQFIKSEGTMVCGETFFSIRLRKGLVATSPQARDASLGRQLQEG